MVAALAACAIAAGAVASRPSATPSEDYAAIFGEHYAGAERFLRENTWIARSLRLPPEQTRIALAVVFPELIRFNALEDSIQVRGLKVLYVQYGRAYMNFSVGRFQMKPSFAEQLEADCERFLSAVEHAAGGLPAFERGDTSALREKRVLRLDDMAWQAQYLRLFMLVMEKRYGQVAFSGTEDRLRFYATAYNAGYASGERALRQMMNQRRFHTALVPPKTVYNYADVAWFYFVQGGPGSGRTAPPVSARPQPAGLERRDARQQVEIAVVVEHGQAVPDRARGDQAVDAGADRQSGSACGPIQTRGLLE